MAKDFFEKLGKLRNNTETKEIHETNSPNIENIDNNSVVEPQKPINNPKINILKSELNEVIEAKSKSAISKELQKISTIKKQKIETTPETKTAVDYPLNMELGWRLKKQNVFVKELNNHLYSKLINDESFFNQIINEIKAK